MRLKQRAGDFRVRELLREGLLGAEGEHRVYRVTKTKLTSLEAAEALATEAGVDPGSVAMAGLKDRQGITVQHMSLHRGREVRLRTGDLRIETIGFAAEELSSEHSRGNAFEITVRALDGAALETLRKNLVVVREHGLVNYFDDQRFGNLRHGQGWIARELMFGRHEAALRDLIAAGSPFDDKKNRAFKGEIQECWGDWTACREVAGRFGRHHSIFEHLQREPEDFAGAFYRVASRLRLIHLYAFQSHLFNRAVAETLRRLVPLESRVVVESAEGPLVCPAGAPPAELGTRATFRLPGPGLEDVRDPEQREALARVLEKEGLAPERFRIEGVPGFQLKGEDRALLLHPQHLRVRPPDDDTLNRGFARVRIRFELPRGAYATLVVKRLFARDLEHAGQRAQADSRPGRHGGRRGSHGGARRGEHRGGGHARSDNRIDNRAERGREGERGGGSRGAGGRGGGRRHGGQGGHGELRPAERREGTRREDGERSRGGGGYGSRSGGGGRQGGGSWGRSGGSRGGGRPGGGYAGGGGRPRGERRGAGGRGGWRDDPRDGERADERGSRPGERRTGRSDERGWRERPDDRSKHGGGGAGRGGSWGRRSGGGGGGARPAGSGRGTSRSGSSGSPWSGSSGSSSSGSSGSSWSGSSGSHRSGGSANPRSGGSARPWSEGSRHQRRSDSRERGSAGTPERRGGGAPDPRRGGRRGGEAGDRGSVRGGRREPAGPPAERGVGREPGADD